MESARASAFCNGGRADRDRHPMNCVSVPEAEEYCRARGGRLPLAAEWEWAARGAGARTRYPWGNADVGGQLCWGRPQPRRGTCPIGNHPADTSPQGILDLAGNVTEWVHRPEGHVRRAFGASWYAVDDGYIAGTMGGVQTTSPRNETVGFRCAGAPP